VIIVPLTACREFLLGCPRHDGGAPGKRLFGLEQGVAAHYPLAPARRLADNGRWRWSMGDKGKKDKEKGQKQHATKDRRQEQMKLEKQPKRRT
jgi:hypothetical protein